MSTFELLALPGSIREGLFNRSLLTNAANLVLSNVKIEIFEGIENLPFYSESMDGENLIPEASRLRNAIESADGILIAGPEHNFSLSAVLKNALDWTSRPDGCTRIPKQSPLPSSERLGACWEP